MCSVTYFQVLNNRRGWSTSENIFSWTRDEFVGNLMSGWSVCWSVHLVDLLESRSAVRVGHNWFLDAVQRGYLHQQQQAESSGLQLLVMHLCCWWVEQSLWEAFCLHCSSPGSQSHALLTHFSGDFSGCLAVFDLTGCLRRSLCFVEPFVRRHRFNEGSWFSLGRWKSFVFWRKHILERCFSSSLMRIRRVISHPLR